VTETRTPKKDSQFQFARLNNEVNLHLWENAGAEQKVAPGDRIRITNAKIGDHEGHKQVSDTSRSTIEVLEESDSVSRSDVAPKDRSRASPDWEGSSPSVNTPAALGADTPRTDRDSDDGEATTISRVDQSGPDSKTATLRHTGDREETKPWEKSLYNTSWWEDQEWSRPHEHSSEVPDSTAASGSLGDYEPSVSEPFHDCGSLATINTDGQAYCQDCDEWDTEHTSFPRIESGFEQYRHEEPKLSEEAVEALSVSDVDADI
jgi:hypothetical protein